MSGAVSQLKLDFILHRARCIARDELFLALGFSRISLLSRKKRPARSESTLIGFGSASGYGHTCDRSKAISLTFVMPPSAAARQKFQAVVEGREWRPISHLCKMMSQKLRPKSS